MVKATIAQLFGRSPIHPLQEHMQSVLDAANGLEAFLQASFVADWKTAEESYNQISHFEHKADDEKKEIRLQLPRSLFMPIPRNDLLTMLSLQDRVANAAKDISGLMLGRQLVFPATIQSQILDLVRASVAVAAEAKNIIDELDELLETGFVGSEVNIIEKLIVNLDGLENKADGIEIEVRSTLMNIENDLPPIDVMFMYMIIEKIGNLADRAQKVGDHVHIIVAR